MSKARHVKRHVKRQFEVTLAIPAAAALQPGHADPRTTQRQLVTTR